MHALCAAAQAGDWELARRTHERWLPLFRANFSGGPNPVPVKSALALMGLFPTDSLRPPLLAFEPERRQQLATLLRSAGLVEASGGRMAGVAREMIARESVA